MANQDSGLINIELELGIIVYPFFELESGPITISLELETTATGIIPNTSGHVLMDLELDTTVGSGNIIKNSGPILMFNLLDMSVGKVTVYCVGTIVNFIPQVVYVDLCKTRESEMIQRYKIDTYPLQFVFSMNNNHNITDYDFILQTKIGEGSSFAKSGVKVDEVNGLVTFDLDAGAMANVGTGTYQVNAINSDVTVVSTGVFEVLESLPSGV